MFRIGLLAFLLSMIAHLPTPALAQLDDWDIYTTNYKKGPATIMLNLGLKRFAPMINLPYLVITGVLIKDCDNNGLPTEKGLPELYKISDTVQSKLNKLVENKLAGTLTYGCERLDYFYVSDTSRIRERLTRLYQVYFPAYKPFIITRWDDNWKGYFDILYPKEEDMEKIKNQKVISKLKAEGDKLTKVRMITHWIHFYNPEDRNCLYSYAKQEGFITDWQDSKIEDKKIYKLRLIRPDKPELGTMTATTLALSRHAKKCKGIYEGWESPVVK